MVKVDRYTREWIINDKIRIEGDFVDNPNDEGGPTKYGITERIARKFGFTGDMRDLTKAEAFEIYTKMFWDILKLDSVLQIAPTCADKLFDISVNIGPHDAGLFIQEFLTLNNNGGKLYSDLKPDGIVGSRTLTALSEFCRHRGDHGKLVLAHTLCGLQSNYYLERAKARKENEEFLFGWLRRSSDDMAEYSRVYETVPW